MSSNEIKKKVINKIINLPSFQENLKRGIVQDGADKIVKEFTVDTSDMDFLDANMFEIGTLSGDFLQISDIFPSPIMINIKSVVHNALRNNRPDIIMMLSEKVNLIDYERSIMMLCAKMNMFDLVTHLIHKQTPIDTNQYEFIFYLAYLGNLDLLKRVLQNYKFPNLFVIAAKVSAQAIIRGHLDILKFFCPRSGFDSAPDQMFTFFINSISHGGHLDIVKYFVEGGLSIKQKNYQPLRVARQHNRNAIVQYFAQIEPDVLNLLSIDEKMKCGLHEEVVAKFAGNDAICGIMQDPINDGDRYFLCGNQRHTYGYQIWRDWTQKNGQWACPLCFSPVNYTVYVNLKDQ